MGIELRCCLNAVRIMGIEISIRSFIQFSHWRLTLVTTQTLVCWNVRTEHRTTFHVYLTSKMFGQLKAERQKNQTLSAEALFETLCTRKY